MSVSAARAATLAEGTVEKGPVIGFKDGQAGLEHFPFGHDHHVEPISELVSTKDLSNQSFGSIPLDRAAELSRRGDPEPPQGPIVGQDEQRAVTAVNSAALVIYLFEFSSASNSFGGPEPWHR